MSRFYSLKKVALFVASVSILSFSSCSRSNSRRALLDHVPSSSYAVLAIDWKIVSKDPDLKRISKGAEMEKVFTQLGVDGEMVKEFAVFGDPGSSTTAANGLIARGSFDSARIVNEVRRRGWTEEAFGGRQILVNPKDHTWLIAFDKNVFVLGTESGVKDAIEAKAKSENRFTSNPAYRTLSARFEGRQYPILMMVALPQASQDMANAAVQMTATAMDLAGVGPLGDLLSKIGYARGLSCAISHKGDAFPVAVSAVMKDEESAEFVSGALNLLKKLGGMVNKNFASQTNPEAARALQSMSVERSRDVVSVRMTMSNEDLRAVNR